jgi:polyisoprenoid-binding protein YceI
MATPDTQTRAVSTPATRTTWTLDPHHTLVEFSAKHMMVTTVKGRFTSVRGTILADEANPTQSSIEVEIDAASLDSRSEMRDNHLRSADFLDVERYPTITFKSTRIEQLDDERGRVYGNLTIHDATREVALDTTFNGRGKSPYGKEVAGFSAQTSINRKDFGLNWNVALETGGWLVSDTVKIAIEAELVKQ